MSVKIGGIEFDRVNYYAEGDVLYLWVGEPRKSADSDESPEGHYLQFGEDGSLIGNHDRERADDPRARGQAHGHPSVAPDRDV
jgi:hypothetical protein